MGLIHIHKGILVSQELHPEVYSPFGHGECVGVLAALHQLVAAGDLCQTVALIGSTPEGDGTAGFAIIRRILFINRDLTAEAILRGGVYRIAITCHTDRETHIIGGHDKAELPPVFLNINLRFEDRILQFQGLVPVTSGRVNADRDQIHWTGVFRFDFDLTALRAEIDGGGDLQRRAVVEKNANLHIVVRHVHLVPVFSGILVHI